MAQPSPARSRRTMALALLATTAMAAVLGGCTPGKPFSREPKLAAADSIGAVSQWSAAYAKKPQDPKMALGYARSLKAIGSRDRAMEVLVEGYRANSNDGELAAELGRLALDTGNVDIATQALKTAEAQDVRDWRTLSAQGTLRAKRGDHAEAQQYFLAALQEKPDAVSVINNLALSYALDGKAQKSEELLRQATASGHDDRRVRQNLALVLGLQGKFDEARQVASVDMTEQEAKTNMAYLQNMLARPSQFAAAPPGPDDEGDDWTPFAENSAPPAPRSTASLTPPGAPKMQVMQTTEEAVRPPALAAATPASQAGSEASSAATASGGSSTRAKSGTPTAPGAPMDLLRVN